MEIIDFEKGTKPKDIFVYTCQRIAEPLLDFGFVYKKSKNAITKTENGFHYIISFQPSIRFGSTTFLVHIAVESDALAKWRSTENAAYINGNDKGYVLSTSLARLTKRENDWPSYEVSTFAERERSITEINNQIFEYALPFFAHFDKIDQLVKDVKKHGFLPHRKNQYAILNKESVEDFIRCFDDC